MSLKSEIYSLLNDAARLCSDCPEASSLLESINEMKNRLNTPLRVAVVGVMKAGKSTFMNALMNKNILDTGELETTYTVGWFRYAETPSLTICFRDGSTQDEPFENLQEWTVRTSANEKLNDVKYVIIYYPSEALRHMEFIDTPGLNSIYGTDAQNTLDFLSIKGSEDTLSEASNADAVIYAFSRSTSGFDKEILESFHSGGKNMSTPINSVGILTKADISGIWDIFEEQTPVESAKIVSETIMNNSDIKKQLFSVFPVCAKAIDGYFKLDDEDWLALKRIAQYDLQNLKDNLYDAHMFATSNDSEMELFGPVRIRKKLIQILGQYGILEIVRQLQNNKSEIEIGEILQEKCGISSIQKIINSHFGNRTFLIKSQYILNYFGSVLSNIKKASLYNSKIFCICSQIEEELDELLISHQTLNELKILQMYYNGQLNFDDEQEQYDFLRITGEFGRSAEKRLGVDNGSSISQLKERAKEKVEFWHSKSGDFMRSNNYVTAATIIARSYEQMYYHLSSLDEE